MEGNQRNGGRESGYLKRKIATRDGKRNARKWDDLVYWVRLQGTKMHFFMVENMYNHGESHPPPVTTVEPPREHMHKLKEEPIDVTQYWVDNLYYKGHDKRRDNTFFLELKHECRVLGCGPHCKHNGRVMEKIVFQAPSQERMKQWAVALQEVGQCAQRLLEDTLQRPPSSAPSRDPAMVQQEMERIRQRLMECKQMDEHLSFMLTELNKTRDMYRIFHYWDKTCGETRLVDTTRERLEAILLKDYHLYPGAEWSKLTRGTVVLVVGKSPVGNMYCVKTLESVVCTESSPAKWDSGFLSVAPLPEGTSDGLEEAESGGRAGEVFALEIGDSPSVQGRQRRMSVSCPSSPVLPRRHAPAIQEGEGPERPHKDNALTIPLVGFVASSALDRFSSQDGLAVSLLVDSRSASRRVSWNSAVVDSYVVWPNSLVCSRDAEDSNWSIRDFHQLWGGTGDSDSMEGMESDSDQVSLTPPSSSSHSVSSLGRSPSDAVGSWNMPKSAHLEPPPSLSQSAPTRKHPLWRSLSRAKTRRTDPRPPKHQPAKRVFSNPPFGEERELRVEVGGGEGLGYHLDEFDPEGEAVQHVFVVEVEPGSPTYRAGLFRGDAICEVEGVDVRYRTLEGIQEELSRGRLAAMSEGRSKITMRVQWRNGPAILSKVEELRQRRVELTRLQEHFRVLVDREMAVLAGTAQGGTSPTWQGEDSGRGVVDDVISVIHAGVATLRADYFILPTLPFLLFTYLSGNTGQDPFLRGVHSVREAAGVSLRDELAVTLPPRKGTIVFTMPHQLKARGMCHLVMGSTHQHLEQACLKALEHARGFQSKQLVFAGFTCDQVKILMRSILQYSKPEPLAMPKCVFASETAEQAKDYTTCLELVCHQLHTTWDESYKDDMDYLVSQQAGGVSSS